ncbi:MAG: Rpn family recombination-promoting nuclease/putative transposase [Deltaproteobacteria bacterium]|nr:Rpn family recombination-promoting nuclease/putative transposase [Deltaproteobacteria bacterium]
MPPALRAALGAHVPSFEFVLHDLARIDDASLRVHPVLGVVHTMLKHIRDKDLITRLPDLAPIFADAYAAADGGLSALRLALSYLLEARDDLAPQHLADFLEQHVSQDLEELAMSTADRLREEGRQQERVSARLQAQRRTLHRLIELRFGPPSPATEARLQAATEADLARWVDHILTAASVDELLGS